jgi:hypothetical protein
MKRTYNSLYKEIFIPYASMIELRKEGKICLGISDVDAEKIITGLISYDSSISLASIKGANRLWLWVSVGLFIYSIYLSFTENWLWLILGFSALGLISNANRTSNSENILDHVMIDPVFYDSISILLSYQMDDSDAEQFKL